MRWYFLYRFLRYCFAKFRTSESIDAHSQIKTKVSVSTPDLKRLLDTLSNYPAGVRFRCRPAGGGWMKHFCQISNVRDNTIVLFDPQETKYYMLNIEKILQFDLDKRWQDFKPNHHYNVYAIQKEQERIVA